MKIFNSTEVKTSISHLVKLLYVKASETRSVKKSKCVHPYLMAQDGRFLGTLNPNVDDIDSIFNPYGLYGSKYSGTSIFNEEGTYGNENSAYSPFNELSQTPPKIIYKEKIMGYLTKNDKMPNFYDTDEMIMKLETNKNLKAKRINWIKFFSELKE